MDYFDILLAKKLANKGDITTESLSVTSNGTYTAPSGKAYTPVTVSVQPPDNSYQLKSITTPTPLATFEASAMPMPSLKVSVEAKQDLSHGVPSPTNICPISGWDEANVTRCGKNLLENTLNTITYNGVTFTVNNDGSMLLSGTASGTAQRPINNTLPLKAGQYVLSGMASGGSSSTRMLYISDSTGIIARDTGNGATFTLAEDTTISVLCWINNGQIVNDVTVYPMIRLASEVDATFEPYNGVTTTISLGQTVYGAEVDVVNGVLRILYELKRADSLTWQKNSGDITNYLYFTRSLIDVVDINKRSNVKCSGAKTTTNYPNTEAGCYVHTSGVCYLNFLDAIGTNDLSSFNNFLTTDNVTILIPLATPIIIPLTPSLIKSLNGTNNLSVDCGEILEGTYLKALGGDDNA